jgi:putative DNA primase/helicase
MTEMTEILKAALDYQKHGYSVIPISRETKISLVKWKELQSRIASTEEIKEWWKKWPEANVAIITGEISGIDCLDGDGPFGFENLEGQTGIVLPETVSQSTGRPEGGEHRVFKYHGGGLSNGVGYAKNGNESAVDFRTDGGLFVAAPSIHQTGKKYKWAIDPLIEDPADFPTDLLAYLKKEQNVIPGFKTAKNPLEKISNGVSEGKRNDACASMVGHCFTAGMTYEDALSACLEWNLKNIPPLPENEILRTVQSIARKDAGKRFRTKKKLEDVGLSHEKIIECLHSNEDGDADLFKDIHGDDFVYDHNADEWSAWQGHHYVDDETGSALKSLDSVIEVYSTAIETEKGLEHEILGKMANAPGKDHTKIEKQAKSHLANQGELGKRITKLKTASRKKNVLWGATLAEGLTGREWDKKPWLLPCENGVINLKTGKLESGNPRDYLKTACPVSYNPKTESLLWKKFVNEIFAERKDLISYVQRLFGYAITGQTNEDVLPFFYGHGRNGKTLFFEVVKATLGDLAHKTKASTMIDSGRNSASGSADADMHAFRGKRIIWASETNDGNRLNVGRIKELTGSDTLNARAPYARRAIEFKPTHLLCLITNNLPYASASDFALWERVHLIPFNMAFVHDPKEDNERQVDKDLYTKLMSELPGVLNWLVEGCLKWQREGLNPPDVVRTATDEYKESNDLIGDYFAERCEKNPDGDITAGKFYENYTYWCSINGHEKLNGTRFGTEMTKLIEKIPYVEKVTNSKPVTYKGITLKSESF